MKKFQHSIELIEKRNREIERKKEEERKRREEIKKIKKEEERKKKEAELKRAEEARKAAQKLYEEKQRKLRRIGRCAANYEWRREGDHWRCWGGSHVVRDCELGW